MDRHIRLGVNIDHVATLRQARGTTYPSPLEAGLMAEGAGADGITLHLREDRRHIQNLDVELLQEQLTVPMNLEMAATESMIAFAEGIGPECCCLVPEKREELTTEGGLNVLSQMDSLRDACGRLVARDIVVSLFIDADHAQIDAAKAVGAPVIELHTGKYAHAQDAKVRKKELEKIIAAAYYADSIGLVVNAGHGLHYSNTQPIASIAVINELNIGHSIVAAAVFLGLPAAVKKMKAIIANSPVENRSVLMRQLEE